MFETLPATAQEFMDWPWARIAPYYEKLARTAVNCQHGASMVNRLEQLIQDALGAIFSPERRQNC